MSLVVVTGCMFSGKSSYLLSLIRKYNEIGWPIFIITSSLDKRYTDDAKIVNHNRESSNANCAVKTLYEVEKNIEYLKSKVVIIEEGQFFPDLLEFVREAVELFDKHVIVAGLDGDAQRNPFGKILDIIPLADSIIKLKAYCKKCNDGTEALFTSKKQHDSITVDIGSSDKYEALCRKHYITNN